MASDPMPMLMKLLDTTGQGYNGFAQGQRDALQNVALTQQIMHDRRQADQDQQYQVDFQDYLDAPSDQKATKLGALIGRYPRYAAQVEASYDAMDKPQRESHALHLFELMNAAKNGKGSLVSAKLGQLAHAEGRDDAELRSLQAELDNDNPDALNHIASYAQGMFRFAAPEKAKALGLVAETEGHFKSSPLGIFDDRTGGLTHAIGEKVQYRTVKNPDGTTTVIALGGDGQPVDAGSRDGTPAASAPLNGRASQPLSARLNNPGAIKFDPKNQWQGQVGRQGDFAQFDTPENGQRAHRKLIANQIKAGYDTPLTWAKHYAPAEDGNDPAAYAATIAKGLGIGIDDKIPLGAVAKMAELSARVEAGGSPTNTPGQNPVTPGQDRSAALVNVRGPSSQSNARVVYSTAPAKVGLDAGTIDFYANKIAAGGDMPQLGAGKNAASLRQAILQRAAQIQTGQGMTGGDSNLLHADVKSAGMALTALQKTRNGLDPFIKTFDAASAQVRSLAPQAVGGSIPIFNRWIQAGRQGISGDPAVAKFNVAINAVANENAKIMSGASGGAVTSDSARHEAMSLINNAMTLDQLNGALDQMHTDSEIRLKSMDDRASTLRGIISGKAGRQPAGDAPPGKPNVPAKAPPAVGTIVRGFRFKGGNPADRNSWVKAQ